MSDSEIAVWVFGYTNARTVEQVKAARFAFEGADAAGSGGDDGGGV